MGARGSLRLVLELDWTDEAIAGRLSAPDGATREFTGWLELTRALEDAQAEAGDGREGEADA